MKIIFFLSLIFSFSSNAQINRSAKELARENIQEYLNNKIFRDHSYKTVSTGELKPFREADPDILWKMELKFETVEIQKDDKHDAPVRTTVKFIFLLNKKMEVVRAESINFQ
jgi:hypothetical protein